MSEDEQTIRYKKIAATIVNDLIDMLNASFSLNCNCLNYNEEVTFKMLQRVILGFAGNSLISLSKALIYKKDLKLFIDENKEIFNEYLEKIVK